MTDFSDIFDMEWAPATAKAADERADLEAEYRALEAEHATIGVNQAWDNNLDAAAKAWGRHEEVFHEVERLYRMKHDDESFAKAIDVAGRNVLRAAGQLVEDER